MWFSAVAYRDGPDTSVYEGHIVLKGFSPILVKCCTSTVGQIGKVNQSDFSFPDLDTELLIVTTLMVTASGR